jgi:hypothetical protein
LDWKTTQARVVATRITIQGYRDADQARPAEIYYRGEANVTYTAHGKQYVVWVPATDNTPDREWLAFQLSRMKDDLADVKWNPADPSQARATLHFY